MLLVNILYKLSLLLTFAKLNIIQLDVYCFGMLWLLAVNVFLVFSAVLGNKYFFLYLLS